MARSDWGIGLVGLGGIAAHHLRNYRARGLKVVGGAEPNAERREARQREFDLPLAVADYRELIARPDVRVVDMNVPHRLEVRLPIFECCARHGKAIFVQKPLANNLSDARTLVEAAAAGGVPLMVNQNSLFVPGFQAIEPYLRDLHSPYSIGVPYYFQIENRGWFDASEHPWFGREQRWVTSDMAIHHLALVYDWFGEAESVHAVLARDPSQEGVVGENLSVVSLRFKSGVQGLVINNWAYRGPHTRAHPTEEVLIQGERGSISGHSREMVIALQHLQHPVPSRLYPDIGNGWFEEAFGHAMAHFVDALDAERAWRCEGRDNLHCVAIVEAAYLSARERRVVPLAEVLSSSRESRATDCSRHV